MSAHIPVEGQDWQQECTRCRKRTCPTPAKVAEWLTNLVPKLHELVQPDLKGLMGLHWQVASYESQLQIHASTWAWALKGVCSACIEDAEPALAELLDTPERLHFESSLRWCVLAPGFPAVGFATVTRSDGPVRVPAVWRGGGLVVHPPVDRWLTGWVVSQELSGLRFLVGGLRQDEAVALAQLLSEVADWKTRDAAALQADPEVRARVRAVLSLLEAGGAP